MVFFLRWIGADMCYVLLCQLCSFKPFKPGKMIPTSGSWDRSSQLSTGWCSVGTIANDAEQFNFDAVFKPGTQARSWWNPYYGPHVKEYRFPSISSELFVCIPNSPMTSLNWGIMGSSWKSIISPVQGGKIFQSLLDVFHDWIQAEVFDTCRDLVQSALDGYNVGPSADSLDQWTQWTQSFCLGGQHQSHTKQHKPLSTGSCSNTILHHFHRSHMITSYFSWRSRCLPMARQVPESRALSALIERTAIRWGSALGTGRPAVHRQGLSPCMAISSADSNSQYHDDCYSLWYQIFIRYSIRYSRFRNILEISTHRT